jgi:hypothetical protein
MDCYRVAESTISLLDNVLMFPDENNRPLFPYLWMPPPVVIIVPSTAVIVLYDDATLVAQPVPAEMDAATPELSE